MLTFTIISLLLLAGFTTWASKLRDEIPTSYSALATDVAEWYPGAAVNPWSVATFLVAFLMLPPMIEAGTGDYLQCLGFFAPLYLIIVALTPGWEKDKRQRIIHRAGAAVCAFAAVVWLIAVRGDLGLTLCVYILSMVAGTVSRTIDRCMVFWLEVGLFASVYGSLIVGG